MKKLILFAAILFAGVSVVKASDPVTPHSESNLTSTTTLKIELKTIQSIEVAESQVLFTFDSMAKYASPSDLDQTLADHLKIYSTGGFKVTVKQESNDEIFGSIGVQVGELNESPIYLTNGTHDLFEQASGGANLKYAVKYSTKSNYDYMNKIVGGVDTNYETVLTYTITAQ